MGQLNIIIAVFWLIIMVVHIYLAVSHFLWSQQTFSNLPKRPTVGSINGAPLNIRESLDDINGFINTLNEHNHQTNIAQLWGYIAGFVAALIGFILSILS